MDDTWLLGVACRLASNYRRLRRHRVEVFAPQEVEEAPAPPENLDDRIAVRQVLALLSDDAALLVHHVLIGETMLDLTHVVGRSKSTIAARIAVARKGCKAVLE